MKDKKTRRKLILKAIIKSFINTAKPISSSCLLDEYDFKLSSATIRNEMAILEEMGLIYQPHTSSGRIPTQKGFRIFVDELMDTIPTSHNIKMQAVEKMETMLNEERLYFAVSLLSKTCDNISFATIPNKNKAYYLGLANILRKPEFHDSIQAYSVIKVLEDSYHFIDLLSNLPIDENIKVFIGNENIIKEVSSCSMIATKYKISEYGEGIIGVLGPMRMNYPFNIGAVEYIIKNM